METSEKRERSIIDAAFIGKGGWPRIPPRHALDSELIFIELAWSRAITGESSRPVGEPQVGGKQG